eukprot:Gb_20600 [translate_table: standard]
MGAKPLFRATWRPPSVDICLTVNNDSKHSAAEIRNVDDKYQYSLDNKDGGVHGWISFDPMVGFWTIFPSDEFRNGGPTKQNLTLHTGPICLALAVHSFCAAQGALPVTNVKDVGRIPEHVNISHNAGAISIYLKISEMPSTFLDPNSLVGFGTWLVLTPIWALGKPVFMPRHQFNSLASTGKIHNLMQSGLLQLPIVTEAEQILRLIGLYSGFMREVGISNPSFCFFEDCYNNAIGIPYYLLMKECILNLPNEVKGLPENKETYNMNHGNLKQIKYFQPHSLNSLTFPPCFQRQELLMCIPLVYKVLSGPSFVPPYPGPPYWMTEFSRSIDSLMNTIIEISSCAQIGRRDKFKASLLGETACNNRQSYVTNLIIYLICQYDHKMIPKAVLIHKGKSDVSPPYVLKIIKVNFFHET